MSAAGLCQVQIPRSEIRFHPLSHADPSGRVFWWEGQLYRGISEDRAPFYKKLFQMGVVQRLCDRGLLIQTEPTDLVLDGYPLVVRHRTVPFASYPYEWCAEMLRDAALLVLDLEIELTQHGLTLQDGHPWNVLFDGCRPVYVDLGSIIPADRHGPWQAYDEFRRFFVHPLYLMSHGYERIARCLLQTVAGVRETDLTALMERRFSSSLARRALRILISTARQRVHGPSRVVLKRASGLLTSLLSRAPVRIYTARTDAMRQARSEVESIVPLPPFGRCSYDARGLLRSTASSADLLRKGQRVGEMISALRPSSVLEVGAGKTRHSSQAALLGGKWLAFNANEANVSDLYRQARASGLDLLPLLMDVLHPSPGCGIGDQSAVPAVERLRCELVLALDALPGLTVSHHLRVDLLAQAVSSFSRKWAILEFVPPEYASMRRPGPATRGSYSLDHLVDCLEHEFRRIEVSPSHPGSRHLLLCEK